MINVTNYGQMKKKCVHIVLYTPERANTVDLCHSPSWSVWPCPPWWMYFPEWGPCWYQYHGIYF